MTGTQERGMRGGAFALLALAVLGPSGMVVEKYLSSSAVVLYLVVGCMGLLIALRLAPALRRQPPVVIGGLTAVLLLIVVVALVTIYPIANVHAPDRGSDSDDALDITARALMAGHYPYTLRTYLGNPPIPLPGEIILALPFVLLGGSAYQILLWLPAALFILTWLGGSWRALWLVGVAILLSPEIMHGIVTGTDHLSNSIIVLAGFLLAVAAGKRDAGALLRIAGPVCFGVALSSRANYAVLLPVLVGSTARHSGHGRALLQGMLVCAVGAVLTLPFYFHDPAHFAPLSTADKTAGVPYGWVVVPASGFIIAIIAAIRSDGSLAGILRAAFLALAAPVVIVAAAMLVSQGTWEMTAYLDLTTIFGLASFGMDLLNEGGHGNESSGGSAGFQRA